MTIQEQIMAKRLGLRLAFIVPGRKDVFVCYPKDEASKAAWLATAERQGWKLA
jgi:hypothetical protein